MSFFRKIAGWFNSQKRNTVPPIPFSTDALTDEEKQYCLEANLSEEDGLFLKRLTKNSVEKLVLDETTDQSDKINGIFCAVRENNSSEVILKYTEEFRGQGKYIFHFRLGTHGFDIAITGATNDPYKLMQLSGTNGLNSEISTEDILEKYRKWDKEFGIIPIGIGFDYCECAIRNTNINFNKLAAEVYEFCSDVVDQGTETLEALEEEMKRTGTIYLWWD